MEFDATIVYEKNWDAINLKSYFVKKKDDGHFDFFKLNNQTAELEYHSTKKVDVSKYDFHEYPGFSYLCDKRELKEFEEEIYYNRYKYILNSGSSRSSKTISIIDCCDTYARSKTNKRITVWRDTKTDCKKTVLNDTLKRLKKTNRYKVGQEFNKTESIFTYSTESTFEIHGTDDEETVHGLTQDLAWLNEPYKISKDTFDQIDQRTSDCVIIDLNPKKGHWSDDLIKNPRTLVIHSTFKDNPFCPIEQKIKILSYQSVKFCRIVVDGLLSENEAKVYNIESNENNFSERIIKELIRCKGNEEMKTANNFKWSVYGLGAKAERPNRIFNWREVTKDFYDTIKTKTYYGVDWGKVDPMGVIEVKYYDGALYLHEKSYLSEDKLKERLTAAERKQISEEPEGFIKWYFLKLGISCNDYLACDTNRPEKIRALRDAGFDYAFEAYKGPGSVIDGIDLLDNLQIFFTASSENLKYEQENYSRKVDKYGEIQEEPEDCNNHLIDPIRYVAQFLRREGIIKGI